MADKTLNSITFPQLGNKYTVPQVDTTLSISGRPADAKATGDEIADLQEDLSELGLTVVNGAINTTYTV